MTWAQQERRRHKRQPLACPISLTADDGQELAKARTLNISDGGTLLPVPSDAAPPDGARVRVSFSVPRQTANTYMLEDFACGASVVRRQPAESEDERRVALQFEQPLNLGLEV